LGNPHRSTDEAHGGVILCLYREHLVALHGFIKKTRTTPDEDLALARKRQKELMR
jgi:phage-related protein